MSTSASQPTTPGRAVPRPAQGPATTSTSSPTTPTKSTEAYESICGICFTDVHPIDNPRGRLNSCHHLFCSFCIKEWAKSTNVCPNCKARFTRVYTVKPDTGAEEETKVRKRNYAAWNVSDEDEDDAAQQESALLESVVCDVCRQSHNAARMIFCDRRQCTYAVHLDCLGLAERPVTFLCNACTKLREGVADDLASLAQTHKATLSTDASPSQTASRSPPPPPSPPSFPLPVPTAAAPPVASRARGRAAATRPPAVTATPSSSQLPQRRGAPSAAPSRASAPTARTTRVSAAPRSSSTDSRPQHRADALASSSDSSSSSSSSLASSRVPSSSSGSSSAPGAPRAAIDFSKPHLHLMAPTPSSPRREEPAHPEGAGDDDYYFLAPTSHAVAAAVDLSRLRQTRAAEAQMRQLRGRATAERLQAVYGVRPSNVRLDGARKRARGSAADDIAAELDSAEKEFSDPQQRRMMEARMVRTWAADILPVLRRRRYIDGDTVTTEDDLWVQATTQARQMVRERMDTKGESLRRRREQLVRAQAQREAAALAKLASIIAQHREGAQRAA